MGMDRDASDDLTGQIPIVPHETAAGVDCGGCIVAAVEGNSVELRCNECGAVVGVVQVDILKALLGLECAQATCPHCAKLNTFPGFSKMSRYVCDECGKAVEVEGDAEHVEINDETCRWYEFEDGRAPIAVRRSICGRHPDVDEDGVGCLCGKRSPVRSDDLEKVIEGWNAMVDSAG